MAGWKSKVIKWILIVAVVVIAGAAGYTWLTLNWSFSHGLRSGYVQKFSKKGWVCKTWEGELLTMPIPGTVPDKFPFSVRDEKVAQK